MAVARRDLRCLLRNSSAIIRDLQNQQLQRLLETHFDRSRLVVLESVDHRLAADPQRGRFNHRLQRVRITPERKLQGN